MYIYSNTSAKLLFVVTKEQCSDFVIRDMEGNSVACPVMGMATCEDGFRAVLDASQLKLWSIDEPVLYTCEAGTEVERFGYSSLRTVQNKMVLLNDAPIYLRGYIRGIVAHDHPNMTGKSDYEAARKNILQAKKYGFNFVRFHSTIPSEDFVRAADELGLLIHMEIGFAYDYDEQGHKKNLSMSNDAWEKTILQYRNHPSMAVFCIGNEMHNSGHYPEVRKLYEQGRALAPGKLIMDNSGWGEYDRDTADIYSQHIAYFFPYKHHKNMFNEDTPWRINGSVYDAPLDANAQTATACARIRRECAPIRPTVAHEAMHYIELPDYEALNAKFDAFAEKVGPEYLKEKGIKKPRFMTAMPELIARKGLKDRMPEYRAGSMKFKMMAIKTYLEEMRLSPLCGYEMLQFSDCLKYENKNGIVDCFDDDKGIDWNWLRQMNDDLVLLADLNNEIAYDDERLHATLYASDFLPQPEIRGDYRLWLDDELLYEGRDFVLGGGLQKLAELDVSVKASGTAQMRTLRAEFTNGDLCVKNDWTIWFYPRKKPVMLPQLKLEEGALKNYLAQGAKVSDLVVTDKLNDEVLADLDAGKHVVVFYEYKAERNAYQLPGALERFKPCIWDRGSNLGGVIDTKLQSVFASDCFFDKNLQPLLEAGTKVNLDTFPVAVSEFLSGIDKPVRDRMKGLIHGVKDFIDADTLRKFSHLFSVKVGDGLLTVCTLNVTNPESPVVANFLCALIDTPELFATDCGMDAAQLRAYLENVAQKGLRPEDVMNHFWEIDNKLVEDTLFWEEVQVDLSAMKD